MKNIKKIRDWGEWRDLFSEAARMPSSFLCRRNWAGPSGQSRNPRARRCRAILEAASHGTTWRQLLKIYLL
jgi:hypothetical protein